jgi:hypothetical protein
MVHIKNILLPSPERNLLVDNDGSVFNQRQTLQLGLAAQELAAVVHHLEDLGTVL